jgi:hypothetical protein
MSIASLCTGDIVVKQAFTHTAGPSMDDIRDPVDIATLSCLVQIPSARELAAYAARGSAFSHWVFFSADPSLTVNNRLKWTVQANVTLPAPKYLRVLDCYPEGRPGENMLWIADCELQTIRAEG